MEAFISNGKCDGGFSGEVLIVHIDRVLLSAHLTLCEGGGGDETKQWLAHSLRLSAANSCRS